MSLAYSVYYGLGLDQPLSPLRRGSGRGLLLKARDAVDPKTIINMWDKAHSTENSPLIFYALTGALQTWPCFYRNVWQLLNLLRAASLLNIQSSIRIEDWHTLGTLPILRLYLFHTLYNMAGQRPCHPTYENFPSPQQSFKVRLSRRERDFCGTAAPSGRILLFDRRGRRSHTRKQARTPAVQENQKKG